MNSKTLLQKVFLFNEILLLVGAGYLLTKGLNQDQTAIIGLENGLRFCVVANCCCCVLIALVTLYISKTKNKTHQSGHLRYGPVLLPIALHTAVISTYSALALLFISTKCAICLITWLISISLNYAAQRLHASVLNKKLALTDA